MPVPVWTGLDGSELSSGNGISISNPEQDRNTTTVVLEFDPLKTSDAGVYVCLATVEILQVEYNQSSNQEVIVRSKNLAIE